VEQFRQRASARQTGRRSPGRYPNELRELALSHLAALRRQGGRASQAARDLGVDANTLRVWEKKQARLSKPTSTLLPVEVSQPVSEAVAPYVVVGPRGMRVECATADAVANLFAALS
jgi:DNA-binding transcriptional regulator YiaG